MNDVTQIWAFRTTPLPPVTLFFFVKICWLQMAFIAICYMYIGQFALEHKSSNLYPTYLKGY